MFTSMPRRPRSVLLASIAGLALLAPACSSDDTTSSSTPNTQRTDSTTADSTATTAGGGTATDDTTDPSPSTDDTTESTDDSTVSTTESTTGSTTKSTTESTTESSTATTATRSTSPGSDDEPSDLSAKSAAAAKVLHAIVDRAAAAPSKPPSQSDQAGQCPLSDDPRLTGWGVEATGSVYCEGDDQFAFGVTIDAEAISIVDEITASSDGEVTRNEPYANGRIVVGCMSLPGGPATSPTASPFCVASWADTNATVLAVSTKPGSVEALLVEGLEQALEKVAAIDPASVEFSRGG